MNDPELFPEGQEGYDISKHLGTESSADAALFFSLGQNQYDRQSLIALAKERLQLPDGTRPVDIIAKTRDKQPLTREEIFGFINGLVAGTVSDEQAAAWLMTVRLNGLTDRETVDLTMAMAASGKILDLDHFGVVADKHSSGGVGDKTTLVVAPLVAACGILVGKMSGRGLGHTGGTLDKLEAIPGFRTDISVDQLQQQVGEIGIVIAGQTDDLAPADGKLYSLRDVTGSVESIPLIASSIMSKKIASGANTLVLDVKVGTGAFMKTLEEAQELARLMVMIGKSVGINCIAEISDMNQPLGLTVGNALEVKEAIDALWFVGSPDFIKHCVDTAAHIVLLSGKTTTFEAALQMVEKVLHDGSARRKFAEMVAAQGGDPTIVDKYDGKLPRARYSGSVPSKKQGYVSAIDPHKVGTFVMKLGGGRLQKGDPIDPAVGVEVHVRVGDWVKPGNSLFTIYTNDQSNFVELKQELLSAVTINEEADGETIEPVPPLPLTYGIVE